PPQVHGLVEEGLWEAVRSYDKDPSLTAALDAFQQEFSCCGVDNYTDWASLEQFRANDSVPSSCCRQPSAGCNVRPSPATVFTRGCLPSLEAWVRRNMLVVAAVALGIAFFEVRPPPKGAGTPLNGAGSPTDPVGLGSGSGGSVCHLHVPRSSRATSVSPDPPS
ncbi:CD63 antigen-like, partial [Pyrgilauda ruficollis]|uniref:CD63 antigen-like n=1 Tax=Pyrgilauda ruficollis TaxID=221976 RepID=UPI001B86F46F